MLTISNAIQINNRIHSQTHGSTHRHDHQNGLGIG